MKVYNPETNRWIKKGGVTHQKLLKNNPKWKELAPQTVEERRKVFEKCGSKCFLGLIEVTKTGKKKYKYPVCQKNSDCKISTQGLKAAKQRAILVSATLKNKGKDASEHEMVIRKANRLLRIQ